jgi:multisubunit Na+/H+ antiporter MnhG subunit
MTQIERAILCLLTTVSVLAGIGLFLQPWSDQEVLTANQTLGVLLIALGYMLTKWLRPRGG